LATTDNILTWAKIEGRKQYLEIQKYLERIPRFNKRGLDAEWDRSTIQSMPLQDARFGAVGFDPSNSIAINSHIAELHRRPLRWNLFGHSPFHRAKEVLINEGLAKFVLVSLRHLFCKYPGKIFSRKA